MSDKQDRPASPGTRQCERVKPALDPASAPLDGRTAGQIATDVRDFADQLAYWTNRNQFVPDVRWSPMFPDLESLGWQGAELEANQQPQKGLFLAFLKLFQHAQDELNGLTGRHLAFQYRDVLRLAPNPAQPDHAHLVLALKRSIQEARIPLGTPFQTEDGLVYESSEEIFARQVGLVHQRTIHVDPGDGRVRAAPMANSLDGLGEDLDESDPSWHPFGANRELPTAERGFAISSPLLLMHEGERKVTVILKLSFATTPPEESELSDFFEGQLEGQLSGEEEWIPLPSPTVSISGTTGNDRTITLTYSISGEEPAIVSYDPTVLPGGFDTLAPVLKWISLDSNAEVSTALSEATINSLQLKIAVEGMKDLELENDHGRIDSSKPFYPFGPMPNAGSSFYLGAPEAFDKKVTAAKITIDWKNPPGDFSTRYAAYDDGSLKSSSSFTAQFQILQNGRFEDLSADAKELFHATDPTQQVTIDSHDSSLGFHPLAAATFEKKFSRLVKRARIELPYSRVSIRRPVSTLQAKPALQFRSALRLPLHRLRQGLRASTRKGFLRLRLNQGFGQNEYPAIFARNVAHNSDPDNKNDQRPIPEPPYLPEIATVALDYDAETPVVNPGSESEAQFHSREIRFFHLEAFGQREEHRYIKKQIGAADQSLTLLPSRAVEGQLILGFTGLGPDESISLLVQVRDGTADPNTTRREIRWSFLSSNHWIDFRDEEILADTTEGFLTSGIVRLLIPRAANLTNTILEPDLLWIRASVEESTEATCRVMAIYPNAVPVSLVDPSLAEHLDAGLPPEKIVLPAKTLPGVKEVTQPYASTGGSNAETEENFRKRASERLRHRGRASTAWDYEHLVLQEFPGIFRVQTLNHTDRHLARSPGNVTLVCLPDASASESATSLTPQVDATTLASINEFLAGISSDFVTVEAVNPAFEAIHLSFKVSFRAGHPFNSYREILRQDLQDHLAPWTTGKAATIAFNREIFRSALIAFIDGRPYVDYLTEPNLFHHPHGQATAESVLVAESSKPGAVLTPTGTHVILPAS